jgi:hypothetical protein
MFKKSKDLFDFLDSKGIISIKKTKKGWVVKETYGTTTTYLNKDKVIMTEVPNQEAVKDAENDHITKATDFLLPLVEAFSAEDDCPDCRTSDGLCDWCQTAIEVMRGDFGEEDQNTLQKLIEEFPQMSSRDLLLRLKDALQGEGFYGDVDLNRHGETYIEMRDLHEDALSLDEKTDALIDDLQKLDSLDKPND